MPGRLTEPAPTASAAVFAGPSWRELGQQPPRAFDRRADADEADDAAAQELANSSRWPEPGIRRWLIERRIRHLGAAARAQLERRERTKLAVLACGGEVRRIHGELGRRLVARSDVPDEADVELLTIRELRRAVTAGTRVSKVELDRRRARHEKNLAAPPLPLHITPGTPDRPILPAVDARLLTGWAVSGGHFVGTARVVDGPDSSIGPDEVAVAVTTDPSWSPLLMRCGALVLEQGGPLSHAAILAREFDLPAVFNVPGAVAALDGHRVAVDGDLGVISILEPEAAP